MSANREELGPYRVKVWESGERKPSRDDECTTIFGAYAFLQMLLADSILYLPVHGDVRAELSLADGEVVGSWVICSPIDKGADR